MTKYALTFLLLAAISFAQAAKPQCQKPTPIPTPTPAPTPVPTPTPVSDPVTNSTSSSTAAASATSAANSASNSSATGGTATSAGGNASQDQGQSVTENYSTPRQTPMAYAPTVLPTNCLGSLSGGASAPVGAISLGGTKRDKNCESIVTANMFAQLKNFQAAAKILCSTDAAKRAHLTQDDCAAVFVPEPPTIVVHESTPAPQITIINTEPIEVVPTPEQLKEIKPVPVPKKVIKRKPCVVPDSLKQPMEK
jgi:hypothetical protein